LWRECEFVRTLISKCSGDQVELLFSQLNNGDTNPTQFIEDGDAESGAYEIKVKHLGVVVNTKSVVIGNRD